jgi:hypothetical protein
VKVPPPSSASNRSLCRAAAAERRLVAFVFLRGENRR